MKLRALVILSAVATLSSVLLSHGPATAAGDAIAFSAPQAVTGAHAYAQNCASCHGAKLQGVSAPALIGKTSAIAQQSLVEVYEYVSQQMPMTAPGSLTKAQYLSILAFLAQKNGHKAGAKPLTEAVATTGTASIASNP